MSATALPLVLDLYSLLHLTTSPARRTMAHGAYLYACHGNHEAAAALLPAPSPAAPVIRDRIVRLCSGASEHPASALWRRSSARAATRAAHGPECYCRTCLG